MSVAAIDTERLRLRRAVGSDVDDLHALWVDPDVRRFLWDDVVVPRSRAVSVLEASDAEFAARGYGLWTIRAPADRALLGFVGLRSLDGDAELLVGLAPAWWRRGLATEATRAVVGYGFGRRGLRRIVAHVDAPNVASIRLVERVGMRPAGRLTSGGTVVMRYAIDAGIASASTGADRP